MGFFATLTEGGQTWAHRMRMLRQVFKTTMICALIGFLISIGVSLSKIPVHRFQSVWYYSLSCFTDGKVEVDTKFWGSVTRHHYSGDTAKIEAKRVSSVCKREIEQLQNQGITALLKALKVFVYVFGGALAFFMLRGFRSRRKKHISGNKLKPAWKVSLRLRLAGKASFLRIGQLLTVKGAETQHFLVTGGTGSGKTTLFHQMLPQIRSKGQKAIIVDLTGDYVKRYYRPEKDVLLNPFDPRGRKWTPWAECSQPYHFDALAESFIPQSFNEHENYWRGAGRSVFSSVLQVTQESQDLDQLVRMVLFDTIPHLASALSGTKAAAHLDMASDKTAGSIRSLMVSFLECLEVLPSKGKEFSIRDWVQSDTGDSWLFLCAPPAQRATVLPLLSAWLSIGMRSLLELPIDIDRRLWFVVDELPVLNKIRDLQTCVTESRKFGGCFLGALQSPAQLEMVYGKEAAQVISGNCGTKIAFYEQDPLVAQGISKVFGENEILEYKEGISYGANTVRDGVSLSPQSKRKSVVSASQIQSLDKCEAFVQLPGKIPVSRVKLRYP